MGNISMHVAFAFLPIGFLKIHSQQLISGQEDLVTLGMAWPHCPLKGLCRIWVPQPRMYMQSMGAEVKGMGVRLLGLTPCFHHRQAM